MPVRHYEERSDSVIQLLTLQRNMLEAGLPPHAPAAQLLAMTQYFKGEAMLKRNARMILATALFAIAPLTANAGDLIVNNHTDYDSTSIINNGSCSTILGEMGISRKHTDHNVVPDSKVRFACFLNKKNCKADVYMSANCTGPKIATVLFDVDTGIKSIQMLDPKFQIIGSGFTTTMEQK